jgi:hypothetical protein
MFSSWWVVFAMLLEWCLEQVHAGDPFLFLFCQG